MKKNILFSMCASLLLFASCDYNEDNFPGFDELTVPTDVQTVELSLADGDYKKVSSLKSNRELALSKDPEGKTFLAALDAVGKNKYFTADAPATWYLPAYIDSVRPYLSDGSKVTVIYKNAENLPEYLADFGSISTYEFSSSDYKKVWGENVAASFLSPSTVSKIPTILGETVKNPADGALRLVNYAYSETEPSTGGGTVVEYVYQKVKDIDTEGGNYIIVAPSSKGEMYPFGMLNEGKDYGYMYPKNSLAVNNDVISSDEGAGWVITVTPTSKGYSLLNPVQKYLHLSGNFNSFNYADALPDTGGDWQFNKNSDGSFSIVNVEKNKTIKLNYYNGSYSYGSYPEDSFSKYLLNETMKENGGDFTPQNVALESVSYVWKHDAKNGYWKASAFITPTNYPTESWLVSPEIDLSTPKDPYIVFDAAINFLKNNNRTDFIDVKISTDYSGDVTTSTWTSLEVANWSAGNNWTFVNSGFASLSVGTGKKVRIAFIYKSTSDCAPTVEIKNLKVIDGYYANVYLFKEMPADEVSTLSTKALSTRAVSQSNTSAVYRYNAASGAWQEYKTEDATISVLQPTDYNEIGSTYVSKPSETLPVYLQRNYPYAQKGKTVAVIYYSDEEMGISATEFIYDGAKWIETAETMPKSTAFIKGEGIWSEAKLYFSSPFDGDLYGCVIHDIELDGKDYVWSVKSDSKYIQASGYYKKNRTTESWLVTPEINLKEAAAPIVEFSASVSFLNGENLKDYVTISVSTDYTDDVKTATWTELVFEKWPDGTDYITMKAELSAYKGKTVYLAFKYASTATCAPTVKIKNLSVKE